MNRLALTYLILALCMAPACSTQTAVDPQPQAELAQAHPDLSPDEVSGLLAMREEEKLAHDVYITLGEQWPKRIFSNISRAEQRHMNAIKALLDAYDLDDPANDLPIGQFTDPRFTDLYEQLVAQGSRSQQEAIKVGVAIEVMDIADLESQLEITTQPDIQRVYTNLLGASKRHLRAFNSHLN